MSYLGRTLFLLYRLGYMSAWNPVSWAVRSVHLRSRRPVRRLDVFERRYSSQFGEDGVIEAILARIGVGQRVVVEIGAGDGSENNARRFVERHGWRGILFDAASPGEHTGVIPAFFTRENVTELFREHDVPDEFDLLSIDIDGNDYWIWKALEPSYRPRVVVIEYNAAHGARKEWVMPYDPLHRWDGSAHYGASLAALNKLGEAKGYRLVGCDSLGNNAFFVRRELASGRFAERAVEEMYRPARFGRSRTGHQQKTGAGDQTPASS
jgi:hypothetical protein